MSDWSGNAARKFLEKKKTQQLQDAKVLHDEKLLNLNSPAMWTGLREILIARCGEFNAETGVGNVLGCDDSEPHSLTIMNADAGISLTVAFDQERHRIKVSGLAANPERGDIAIAVRNGSSELVFLDKKHMAVSAEQIAGGILDDLLGK